MYCANALFQQKFEESENPERLPNVKYDPKWPKQSERK